MQDIQESKKSQQIGGQEKFSKQSFKLREVPRKELLGGVMKPVLGFGTWQFAENEVGDALKMAIRDFGYRQIDTAKLYGNEEAIGRVIKECIDEGIVKREDLFITTKLWIDGRDRVESELRESMKRLQVDYLDMYIMHFMIPDINKDTLEVKRVSLQDTWRDLEKCQMKGLCRAIGVSNCTAIMLLEILTFCDIKPASNQIELHPYLSPSEIHEFHRRLGIPLEAYAPLNPQLDPMVNPKFKNLELLKDSVILGLAKKYNKSAAQIVLNWHLGMGHIVFPRMCNAKHMAENMEIFDFSLSEEDLKKISSLNRNAHFYSVVPVPEYSWIPISV